MTPPPDLDTRTRWDRLMDWLISWVAIVPPVSCTVGGTLHRPAKWSELRAVVGRTTVYEQFRVCQDCGASQRREVT